MRNIISKLYAKLFQPLTNITAVLVLLITLLFSTTASYGKDGDTLTIQTFSFDSISTRRAVFTFPDDSKSWSKILMYYTLKCDSATTGDPYPCGEWDVTTHTYVYDHTGRFDSTMHSQPFFKVAGKSPETFSYSLTPRYYYYVGWSEPESHVSKVRDRQDSYLTFEGQDYIEVPPAAVQDLDSSFTISMWVKGDANKQPQNDNLLEAADRGGRVLNIHLPWGTGQIYFDAGGRLGGNNNRLTKMADKGEYAGRWNHWAFTKNVETGLQKIFLNGKLWHEAGNMFKPIEAIDRFTIGSNANGNGGYYAGSLDEIRIWNRDLPEEIITDWRFRELDESHPYIEHLKVNYTFDDDHSDSIIDASPNKFNARSFGQPHLLKYGLASSSDHKPAPSAVLKIDSVIAPKVTVEFYEDEYNPTQLTSTRDFWEAYDRYYDLNGNLLREEESEDQQLLENEHYTYYDKPFEVIERYEIGRFITPYGKGLNLGKDGFTWVYDVSDYVTLLKGEVDLQAANDFELLDLKFVFIEGTPPREVLSVDNIWEGRSYVYGSLADDKELKAKLMKMNPNATGFMVRSRISGHGHYGPRNCCEWDAKEHTLLVNGISRFNWTIWRDCGMNPVHPQGGTWQFDRAGWCPGTWVDTYDHELTPFVQPGSEAILDYEIEMYDPETGEAGGSYVVELQLLSYGSPNFKRDAAVKDIIAPNSHSEHSRQNPVSNMPIIEIVNLGSDPLKSLNVKYGLDDNKKSVYKWKGALGFLESEQVVLPKPDWSGMRGNSTFSVKVSKPNGKKDKNKINNRMVTHVVEPIVLPDRFIVHLETPGFERAAENAFVISDANGTVIYKKSDFKDDTTYQEQIALTPGAYQFSFTDSNEDGMIRHWWLRGSDPERIGDNGLLQIRDIEDNVLKDLGYDFAEKRVVRFFVGEPE